MSTSEGRPPALSSTELVKLINQFYAFDSVDTNSVKNFPGYDDRNYYFRGISSSSTQNGNEFVLKMFNKMHSTHEVVVGISEVLRHLRSKGFTVASCLPNREGAAVTFVPKSLCDREGASGPSHSETYAVRIMHFIAGELFDSIDKKYITPKLLNEAGAFLGRLDLALKVTWLHYTYLFTNASTTLLHYIILQDGFQNAALAQRYIPDWDLKYLSSLRRHLPLIDDSSHRVMVEKILDEFELFIVPKIPTLPKGVLHGDPNGTNLIVKKHTESDEYKITGLIDFDDSVHSCYVFEIGVFLAYTMIENLEPSGCSSTVEFVGRILRGYVDVCPLSEDEISCLFHIVLGRCCQSAVLGEISYKAEPWNTYFLTTPNKAYKLMEILLAMGKEKVDAIWAKAILSK